MKSILSIGFFLFLSFSSRAQDTLAYRPAGFDEIKNVVSGSYGDELNYKIYLPNGEGEKFPVALFINGVGSDVTQWNQYIDWPKATAALKMAGIAYEATRENPYEDSKKLLELLISGDLHEQLDTENIVLWMCSSNGQAGLKILMNENYPQIKGASLYYPSLPADVPFRTDVKVELLRAGKDSYSLNTSIDRWILEALKNDLDLTVANYPGGRHAFDTYDPDQPQTGDHIKQTLKFLHDLAYKKTELSNPKTTPGRLMALLRAGEIVAAEKIYFDAVDTTSMSRNDKLYNGLYNSNGLNGMALALLEEEKYDAAAIPLKWALKLSPEHPNNHDNIAELYLKTGKKKKALEHSQLALKYLKTFNHPNKQFIDAIRTASEERIHKIKNE